MGKLILLVGDITKQQVDAIVNAANTGLVGGGGVDGAIHRAGGPSILAECDRIRAERGGCPTGTAVATTAGRLAAKFVLHTAGPRWSGGKRGEAELLASCYRSCLGLAVELGCRTVAFPSISTGIYGYPIEDAARVALGVLEHFLVERPSALEEIRMVLFGEPDFEVYRRARAGLANPA